MGHLQVLNTNLSTFWKVTPEQQQEQAQEQQQQEQQQEQLTNS